MAIIMQKGIDTALTIYDQFKKSESDRVFFQEGPMNMVGYQLFQRGQIADAVKVFKMNTESYPQSCNTWDSYAEGLIAAGEIEAGKEALRKALEVMPSDSVSGEDLKAAIRAHANQVLGETEN